MSEKLESNETPDPPIRKGESYTEWQKRASLDKLSRQIHVKQKKVEKKSKNIRRGLKATGQSNIQKRIEKKEQTLETKDT